MLDFFPEKHAICYSPVTVVKVVGEDAFPFLQGQFTQDLRPCEEVGRVAYGLWLNQKGKVLADSFVLRWEDAWLCISFHSAAEVIRGRLEAYVVADEVTIEDVTAQWTAVMVFGPGAADLLASHTGVSAPEPTLVAKVKSGFVFQGRRLGGPSWELLYPSIGYDASGFWNAQQVSPAVIERLRIEAGIPAVPCDIGPDDLPNEGGLDRDAISYTKGCYLGQEVMARLKTMGQVRRRLMRVSGPGAPLASLPAPLFGDGKMVGELRSAVCTEEGFVGLAMISLLGVAGKKTLGCTPAGPANIAITAPLTSL